MEKSILAPFLMLPPSIGEKGKSNMKEFWNYFIRLMKDERGEVGDLETKDDDKDPDAVVDDSEDNEDDDESPFAIKIDDEEGDDKDKDKDKKKSEKKGDEDEPDEKDKKIADLSKKVEKLEKDKRKAFYDLRQAKKEPGPETKGAQLTDTQIKGIIADNKDDPETLFNVMKYIAEQTASGISSEKVNAAEVNRKAGELNGLLAERYPEINETGSDIRVEVDGAKAEFGLENHPYGDFFATAALVLRDLPELLDDAYKKGKGETGDTAEEKRKKDIASKKLPASKKSKETGAGLSTSQLETAKQMGLTGTALKTYAKLMDKKPRVVSVEE